MESDWKNPRLEENNKSMVTERVISQMPGFALGNGQR